MSVNITVNGRFGKHCRKHPLLADPQEVKKAEEKERRKLRLLEVREECKKLAKKIRDEVNEEKKRELQKLQATKERELECWRQLALQRKYDDYREAIFQVGSAHEAARIENEKDANRIHQQRSYKDFRKQVAARKSQPGKVQFKCQSLCPCQQMPSSANKQIKCTCTQTEECSTKSGEVHKRKRSSSFSSSESECEDEGYKEQTTLAQSSFSLSSTCDSTSSFSINNHATQNSVILPPKNKCLIKTPAVHLDVEVGADDYITISGPMEIKDKHSEYGRQFSSIIRVSPRKELKQKENTCESEFIQQSSNATSSSSDMRAKEQNIDKSSPEKPLNKQTTAQISKEKRFTIISELVKKQQENEPRGNDNNRVNSYPSDSQTISTSKAPDLSPNKQFRGGTTRQPVPKAPAPSPRKASATSKSSRTATTQPLPSLTMTKTYSAAASGSSSSGRVQFYDYNSKLSKERDQATTAVSVQRQKDQNQPSAMDQAAVENQKERERQLEELRKGQIMEERCQKAVEREQIRRDCNELTEKLEVLSREYANQLPSNENQLHIFADKQLRKEGKMNSAIEKLLQRPSIITCSEQINSNKDEVKHKSPTVEGNLGNVLNVASLNNKPLPADDVSSDSCCSILLGYVDNQSRLVKQDLQNNEKTENQSKQNRLRNLLKRLDQLRSSLVQELRNENEFKGEKRKNEEDNLKEVIDSISELRKEREEIMINENDRNPKLLKEREKELEAKEALLEKKVREFYELQKQQNSTQKNLAKKVSKQNRSEEQNGESSTSNDKNKNKEDEVCTSIENPLEIVITVKGDTKCVKIPQKSKRKHVVKKSPSKLSTLIKSPQTSLSKSKKHVPKKKAESTKLLNAQSLLRRQNSYDSNSTSYMSLPPELPTKIDDLAQRIAAKEGLDRRSKASHEVEMFNQVANDQGKQQESESSVESLNNLTRFDPPPHVNPLIAQYVNRLLGMSRDAVKNLGISSSDIETPTSSIINTTGNITNSNNIISDQRIRTLQNFIEENKSFIKDIEDSIKSQNNTSLENSIKMLDDIWRKRLKTENTKQMKKRIPTDKLSKDSKIEERSSLNKSERKPSKNKKIPQTAKSKSKQVEPKTTLSDNIRKDFNKNLSSHYSTDDKESTISVETYERSVKTVDKAVDAKLAADCSKTESDSQIARYARLTENCTQRIAELTALINRVREEKQHLLEVTLSSVSDNGRQSAEYLEMPEGKSTTRNDQIDLTRVSSSSEETTQNKRSLRSASHEMPPKLSSADKNKHIANSRDSGIAESRPITALENRIDQEPLSHTSSESTTHPGARKMKPPPTLKRFSPQLPEDELAHELSTIFEVDTPATSRVNTAVGQPTEERENVLNKGTQQPIKFPTFEEYIKQLDLDISQLDPEESIQLQHEFATFLEYLRKNRLSADSPKYLDFPSINAYIQQLTDGDLHIVETIDESLAKLHISGIKPHKFPAVRDYIKSNNTSKSLPPDEQQLLDTESLENITDAQTHTNTDNDSVSIDIQEELKRRNIIKRSFRFTENKKQKTSSSTIRGDTAFYQDILAAESGVDKLSTSGGTTSDICGDLRKQFKDFKTLSSTTTSTNASALVTSAVGAASLEDSSKDFGRALNLRDFLTRELEKLVNNSSSTTNSSNEESLRSNFLHSLIESLTPRTIGAGSKSGAQTLERQKTSTPVLMKSSQLRSASSNNSKSSSQMFSGESRLSSVRYADRSVHFVTSEDANADQSSE